MTDKRKELQNKINENEINNNFLYDYIISNNIKYTSNKNGIFINLTKLDDKIIDDMYQYTIKMSFNIKSRNKVYAKKNMIENKINKKKTYNKLPVFDLIENEILRLSKTI